MSLQQMSQAELKKELTRLINMGPMARAALDQLLETATSDPGEDFRRVWRLASPERRQQFPHKLREGAVITRRFSDSQNGRETGCLVFWLFGWESNSGFLQHEFASLADLCAVTRVVRFWDYGNLTPAMVQTEIDEELRREAEQREVLTSPRLYGAPVERSAGALAVSA